MHWGDEDYPACVSEVLGKLVHQNPEVLDLVEGMLSQKTSASTACSSNAEDLFQVASNSEDIDITLATAMMPFKSSFDDVRVAMKRACKSNGLTLKAADDIWNSSVIIRDIFDLIKRSCIVIVDFTEKNPNVMYETGIAHALGKEVIPITQSMNDVPFDLKHHRILEYENNEEGRKILQQKLEDRIKTILDKNQWQALPF